MSLSYSKRDHWKQICWLYLWLRLSVLLTCHDFITSPCLSETVALNQFLPTALQHLLLHALVWVLSRCIHTYIQVFSVYLLHGLGFVQMLIVQNVSNIIIAASVASWCAESFSSLHSADFYTSPLQQLGSPGGRDHGAIVAMRCHRRSSCPLHSPYSSRCVLFAFGLELAGSGGYLHADTNASQA